MIVQLRKAASRSIYLFRDLIRELKSLTYLPISLLPGTSGWLLRRLLLRSQCKLGKRVKIDEMVRIDHLHRLEIGDDTFIGRGSFIHAGGGVIIGRDVLIGPGVRIWSVDHRFDNRLTAIRTQGHKFAAVTIGDDVWIGVDAVILKGVTIGQGAVVAAGSIVTKDVAPFCVVGGVPVRNIGMR